MFIRALRASCYFVVSATIGAVFFGMASKGLNPFQVLGFAALAGALGAVFGWQRKA